jgi:hypothetical protein
MATYDEHGFDCGMNCNAGYSYWTTTMTYRNMVGTAPDTEWSR